MAQKFSSEKRRAFVLFLPVYILIFGLILAGVVPEIIRALTPDVRTTRPVAASYTPYITFEGKAEYKSLDNISLSYPVVIKELKVYPGERVDAGQTVAIIDKEKTISALAEIYGTAGLDTGEVSRLIASMPKNIDTPYSGVVISVAEKGEIIPQNGSIAGIGTADTLVIKAMVSERDIDKVEIGKTAEITAEATNTLYKGKVTYISDIARTVINAGGEETVVDVIIELDNAKGLKSGFSVQGKINIGTSSSLMTLPYTAVCQDDKGEYVYVFSKGVAVRKDITTGIELSDCTEVKGISYNDEVILNPENLKDMGYVIRKEYNGYQDSSN